MNSEERLKKQKELVEEIGRHFDKEGLQPIAGRIVGLLMVMDKEQFTFEEITEELQISKSSASTALKNLEIMNADFKRLGCYFWDWDNPYVTLNNSYLVIFSP